MILALVNQTSKATNWHCYERESLLVHFLNDRSSKNVEKYLVIDNTLNSVFVQKKSLQKCILK